MSQLPCAAHSWADNGPGAGAIDYAKPGVLVILQEERIHMAVLELLETYRTALRLSKPRERGQTDPAEVVTVYYRLTHAVANFLFLVRTFRPSPFAQIAVFSRSARCQC